MKKQLKLGKDTVGRKVSVRYDDIGRVDGICVETNVFEGSKDIRVFIPATKTLDTVEASQVESVGEFINIGL